MMIAERIMDAMVEELADAIVASGEAFWVVEEDKTFDLDLL